MAEQNKTTAIIEDEITDPEGDLAEDDEIADESEQDPIFSDYKSEKGKKLLKGKRSRYISRETIVVYYVSVALWFPVSSPYFPW